MAAADGEGPRGDRPPPDALSGSYVELVAAYPHAAWWLDADGRVVAGNERWTALTGLTTGRSPSNAATEAIHPDDRLTLEAVLSAQAPARSALRLRDSRGEYASVTVQYVPVHGSDGALIGWLATLTDDSPTPPDTRAVREASRRMLEALATSAPVGMAFLDRDGRYVRTNRRARDAEEEPRRIGHTVGELFPEVWEQCEPHFRQVVEEARPARFTVNADAIARGADRRTWEVFYFPVRADDDDVVGVVSLALNVTERERAEAAAEAMRAEVERQRALFEAVFAGSPVGKAIVDREGRYVRVNAALAAANGYKIEEHTGRHIRDVLGDELWEALRPAFDVVLAGGESQQFELAGTTRATGAEVRHWLESLYPVRADGEVIGVGVVVLDITAHRTAQARMSQLNDRLREFVSIASHEIRRPLTSVHGNASLLARMLDGHDLDASPRISETVRALTSEAERLRRVVDLFLDLALVDSGHFTAERADTNVEAVLDGLASEYRRRYPSAAIALECGDQSLSAFTNADLLTQIIGNLIDNALKYAGASPQVTIVAGRAGERCVVRVRDDGPGITPEVRAHLFERYYRGPDRGQDGLGIGLYISKQMAIALGGDLTVGAPEAGAEFILEMPASV